MQNPEKEKFFKFKYDVALLFPVLFLVGLGIVMVYSASSALALKRYGCDLFFIKKQAGFSMLGFIALVVCRHVNYRIYQSLAYPILLSGIMLLVAVHVPGLGHSAGGAERWLKFAGFTFQPAEFAKLALIIFLSYSLNKKKERMTEFSIGCFPHLVVLSLLGGLIIFQPDFGTVVILGIITWVMLFLGGAKLTHLLSTLMVIAPLGYIFLNHAAYRARRMMTFLDPWQYSSDEGYQIVNSLMAFGNGGLWGAGIGKGVQKLFYLPEPHTDFIFSVIGEELGLIGVLVILGLYCWIFWRGILISIRVQDAFGSLLAAGITTALGIQVCINMGVALGLLPTKGLTLPFLSYGGTSLIFCMASVGILMNISVSSSQTMPVRYSGHRIKVELSHDYAS